MNFPNVVKCLKQNNRASSPHCEHLIIISPRIQLPSKHVTNQTLRPFSRHHWVHSAYQCFSCPLFDNQILHASRHQEHHTQRTIDLSMAFWTSDQFQLVGRDYPAKTNSVSAWRKAWDEPRLFEVWIHVCVYFVLVVQCFISCKISNLR